MTGSLAALWAIPIVVAIALFGWLAAVLWADLHPRWKHHSNLPKYEVTGGAFQAVDGGRQLMPRYGGRPVPTTEAEQALAAGDIPAQRTAAEQQPAGARASAGAGASAATAADSAERHLVAGSKLR